MRWIGTIGLWILCMTGMLAQESTDMAEMKRQWSKQRKDTTGLRLALEIAKGYKLNQPDSLTKYAQWVMNQLGDYPREANKHFAAEACYDLSIAEDRRSNFDQAIAWLDKSKNFYDDIDDELGVLYAEVFQAWVYYDKGEVIQALEMAEEAKKELESMDDDLKDNKRFLKVYGNVLSDLSTYYVRVGKSDLAAQLTELSIYIRHKLGDRNDEAEAMMNLGAIYYDIGNFNEALNIYNRVLEIVRQTENKSAESVILANRAMLSSELNDFIRAERDFRLSLNIRLFLKDKKGTGNLYRKLADLYLRQKKTILAIENFYKAQKIYTEIDNPLGLGLTFLGLSMSYGEKGDTIKEFILADTAYKILKNQNSSKSLLKAAKHVQKLYKSKGLYADALAAAEDIQIAQNQIKEEETKELLLKQEYLKKEADANRNVYLSIGGASVLLVIAVLLFRAYRLKRKAQQMAEQQKDLVEERNKHMVDSIQYAQQLQSAILPSPELFAQHFEDHFLLYFPKDIVAGDFYWFHESPTHRFWAVADCTGHGVPGAMVSVVCSNALNRVVKEYNLTHPGDVLNKVRELVVATFQESQREVKDGMDIALCVLEKGSKDIQFAGANRPCWILSESGELQEIKGQKQHIGLQANMEPFDSKIVDLKSGWIVLSSDGLADQFGGPKGKKWMTTSFKQKLVELHGQPGSLQKMNLEWTLQQWKGNQEQVDDICVLGIKI